MTPEVSRWQMVKLLVELDRPKSALVAALIVVVGLVAPGMTYATGAAIAAIDESLTEGGGTAPVVAAAAVLAVLFVVAQSLPPVLGLVAGRFARRIDKWMFETVMSATRATEMERVEDPAHQDLVLIALGRSDWGEPAGAFVTGAAEQWPRRIAGAGAILLVAGWNWPVALLLPTVSVLGLRAWRRSFFSVMVGPETDVEDVRASSYSLGLAINPEFSRETRIFEMRPWLLDRHLSLWLRAMRPVWRQRSRASYLVAASIAANAAVRLVALGLLGRAALRGEVDAALVAVVAPAVFLASQLTWISGAAEMSMQRCLSSVGAMLALRERQSSSGRIPLLPAIPPEEAIRFEGVSFAYPETSDVLRSINLEIPVGHSLAIVGFNGAGKTTMAKLLAGLYQPGTGRITVDGADRAMTDPSSWFRHVAAIFQDFGRYPLTVRENIGWGSPEHLDDEEGIRAAAEQAGAMPLIAGLPDGMGTVLDRRFIGGAEASGGEWQRIAIARALFAVRHGASVLILDEPTAQLDARAEADIYERFLELTAGVTSVIISHRFSTIRRANRIVVLENGTITEQGTHAELVGREGLYAEMFRIQADALLKGTRFADE